MLPPAVAGSGCCKESRIPGRSGSSAPSGPSGPSGPSRRTGLRPRWVPTAPVRRRTASPGEPRRSRPTLVSPPAVVAGAQRGTSMPAHRQTNRRRVSDAFVRAMLRERVRNGLPIDAKTIRGLDIACGSDRLRRLRREVLRQLEREFAVAPEKTVKPSGGATAPVVATGRMWRSPVGVNRQSADLRRPSGARAAHPMHRPFRAGVAAICSGILRHVMAMVHRFVAQANTPSAD